MPELCQAAVGTVYVCQGFGLWTIDAGVAPGCYECASVHVPVLVQCACVCQGFGLQMPELCRAARRKLPPGTSSLSEVGQHRAPR